MTDVMGQISAVEEKLRAARERTKVLRAQNESMRDKLENERKALDERRQQQAAQEQVVKDRATAVAAKEKAMHLVQEGVNKQLKAVDVQVREALGKRKERATRNLLEERRKKRERLEETVSFQAIPFVSNYRQHFQKHDARAAVLPNTYRTTTRAKPFGLKRRDIGEVRSRQPDGNPGDSLKACVVHWPDYPADVTLRADNDNALVSTETLRNVAEIPTASPAMGSCLHHARVLLMTCNPGDEDLHPHYRINFLAAAYHKQDDHSSSIPKEVVCYGGPWDPELDGKDPESDDTLKKTVRRHVKDLSGADIPLSAPMYRFMTCEYDVDSNNVEKHESLVFKQLMKAYQNEVEVETIVEVPIEEGDDDEKMDEDKAAQEEKTDEQKAEDEEKKPKVRQEKRIEIKKVDVAVPAVTACSVPFINLVTPGMPHKYGILASYEFRLAIHCFDEMLQQRFGEKLYHLLEGIAAEKKAAGPEAEKKEDAQPIDAYIKAIREATEPVTIKRRKLTKEVTDNTVLDVFYYFDRPIEKTAKRSEFVGQSQLRYILLCCNMPGATLRKINTLLGAVDLDKTERVHYGMKLAEKEEVSTTELEGLAPCDTGIFPSAW
eukprot:gene1780-2711_t